MGVEAPIWTEYVRDLSRMEYLTYPRLGAIAETAWTGYGQKNYDDFASRLPSYLKLLDIYSASYAGFHDTNPGLWKKLRQMADFIQRAKFFNRKNRKNFMETLRLMKAIKRARDRC